MFSNHCQSLMFRTAAACVVTLLAACTAGPRLRDHNVSMQAVELKGVPYYAQDGYQGGPAALAEALGGSGVQVAPADLVKLVYDPATGSSPQASMVAASGRYGRVPYVLSSNQLDLDVVHLVQTGHPVLVLLHRGLVLKQWRYAVVIGVDPASSTFVLRSGGEQRRSVSYGDFIAEWRDSGYWAMLTARPGDLPDQIAPRDWITAAAAVQHSGPPEAAAEAYGAATRRWPKEAGAWDGLGNAAYALHDLPGAIEAYSNEVQLQPDDAQAHDKLAQALLGRQCADQAEDEVNHALALETDPARRAAYQRTLDEVSRHTGPSVVCSLD
ncbi:MAG: PA2778 family cysteine peptidase [Nevskia sp.]|nr:PA2778 family cysteine peptidase [Nevskia sp.]